ncbi:PAS domain S-box protein (plasmid) [Deinococcus psychrotolerans]|uniref:histidine kinase n=1 Tax=Deinococcus psychrotolerans TaxID=2489213 RepID=A0A3G8YQR6_9DEIO|nr:ATP-binding protein [Deinococcus psychrotolerans]AZI44924.1 PAS domain S-box protein [Deinococcus psychrotolerans]
MTAPRPDQENQLEMSQLQNIVDVSTDCIKVLDLDAHLLSMNAGGMVTMEIGDFSLCQHQRWPSFWEGEARLQVERALEAARAGEASVFEGPAQTFAGTPKWWEVRISPIRDQGGTVTKLLAISRDITARKTAEFRLQESEARLRAQAELLSLQASQNEQALFAFVRFTTKVASSTDSELLATAASDVLREVIGGAMSGFYLIQGDTAHPLMFSSNTPPEVQALRRPGLSVQYPLIQQALEQRRAAFAEHDQARQQSVGYASALSIIPYFRQGQPYALFATGIDRSSWSARERAIIESVGNGLGLALERAGQARQLIAQRDMLQAANEELEAFAYSVSHDLRTPVRHIVSFGALLRRSLPEQLDAKTQRYFNVVETAAVTLNQLIDGMLDLSRTSRQPLEAGQVDLSRLLGAARQEIGAAEPSRQITWQVAQLPVVTGDAALLRRVMSALLSNAVKYTRPREEAVIEVWAEEREQSWAVFVRDNGVGFDPRYKGKLFTVFQRLHRQEDFEGAGVSLANARRIMARHGGVMTADGQIEKGATFGFILPKAASDWAELAH